MAPYDLHEDDGVYALTRSKDDGCDECEVELVEDLLERRLFSSADGELYVKQDGRLSSWDMMTCKFREAKLTVTFDKRDSPVCLLYFFLCPRNGARGFFDAHCLYNMLNCTQYNNTPSMWTWRCEQRWAKLGMELFGGRACRGIDTGWEGAH